MTPIDILAHGLREERVPVPDKPEYLTNEQATQMLATTSGTPARNTAVVLTKRAWAAQHDCSNQKPQAAP
jgi:hypothetical protein